MQMQMSVAELFDRILDLDSDRGDFLQVRFLGCPEETLRTGFSKVYQTIQTRISCR